jgi:MATE family multidrug resistance protein
MNYNISGILKVTIPLILTALSANLMFVADRAILAYYSIDAMNAVGISSNMVALISYMFISIACTAEIYVGQYNGSKQFENLAGPVWQMIYLSLLANIVFIPLGIFAKHCNMLPEYYKTEGITYQSLMSYFCSLPCAVAAISAFFIGQGKTAIISMVVIIGNILNVILATILVFGISGIIPSLGVKGAAIGTILSEAMQLLILLTVFFKKNNRKVFKTFENRKFDKKIFLGCCKIGTPMSIGRLFEIGAWYFLYATVSNISKELATIYGIAINIFVVFAFFQEGLSKAVATLSANLIGMKNLIVSVPLVLFPEIISGFLDMIGKDIPSIYPILKIIFKIMFLSIVFETFGCIFWGILMSGGDTRYPIIVNLTLLWSIVVTPVIIMYYTKTLDSVILIWGLCAVWGILSLFFLYKRYKSLKWYNRIV